MWFHASLIILIDAYAWQNKMAKQNKQTKKKKKKKAHQRSLWTITTLFSDRSQLLPQSLEPSKAVLTFIL